MKCSLGLDKCDVNNLVLALSVSDIGVNVTVPLSLPKLALPAMTQSNLKKTIMDKDNQNAQI